MKLISSCPSTNRELPADAPHGFAVMAHTQTAGRGQRGNSWEAAPGMNITMSVMLRPSNLPAAHQFEVSEAVCLAVADLLRSLGIEQVAVKWPNDVYVGDRKICGILIENSLQGTLLARSIAGIGLNVNQLTFCSDAPNPVSLRQITGQEYPLEPLAERLVELILSRLERTDNHPDYLANLWRRTGLHPWRDDSGLFQASIVYVSPTGMLTLSNSRTYAFKEVAAML